MEKLWTREFILVILLTVLAFCAISTINSTLSTYIVEQHGGSSLQVGLVCSLLTLSALMFRPLAGYIIDRWGRRWTLVAAILLTAILNFAMLLPLGLVGLGIIRFAIGIPFSINTTGINTLTSDLIPENRRAEGFSYSTIIVMLTALVGGPNLGFLILEKFSFSVLFIIAGVFAIMAALVLLIMRFDDIKSPDILISTHSLIERRVVWFALIMGITFFGWPGMLTFGPLYAREVGFASGSLFLIVLGVGLVTSRLFNKFTADARLVSFSGAFSLAIIMCGHVTIGLTRTQIGFLIGVGLMGIGYGTLFSIVPAMTIEMVEAQRRGACNATVIFGQDIGAYLGYYMFGWVAQLFGSYSSSYLVSGIFMVIPIIIFVLVAYPDYRKKKKKLLSK